MLLPRGWSGGSDASGAPWLQRKEDTKLIIRGLTPGGGGGSASKSPPTRVVEMEAPSAALADAWFRALQGSVTLPHPAAHDASAYAASHDASAAGVGGQGVARTAKRMEGAPVAVVEGPASTQPVGHTNQDGPIIVPLTGAQPHLTSEEALANFLQDLPSSDEVSRRLIYIVQHMQEHCSIVVQMRACKSLLKLMPKLSQDIVLDQRAVQSLYDLIVNANSVVQVHRALLSINHSR